MKTVDWWPAQREAWRCQEPKAVTEWAEANIVLPKRWSDRAGPFEAYPWQREILDAYGIPEIHFMTMVAPTQVGKSTLALCMLGYTIDVAPGSVLMIMPVDPDAGERLEIRIKPLIDATPALARHKSSRKSNWKRDRISFPSQDMDIFTGGANSENATADKPLPIVILDEVAKFPPQIGKEPDAVSLADSRNKTYRTRKKRLAISSPKVRGDILDREYKWSDRREYHVPCPHCGTFQPFEWEQFGWPENASADEIKADYLAWFECIECGRHIQDDEGQVAKRTMLDRGVWCPEGCRVEKGKLVGEPNSKSKEHRGWHVVGAMGMDVTWSELVWEYLRKRDDMTKLQAFHNNDWGTWFEGEVEIADEDAVDACGKPYEPNTVPSGALFLTAGVDIGELETHYVVRAWGPGQESWLVRRGKVGGLGGIKEEVLDRKWRRADGADIPVRLVSIDAGHNPDKVHAFCRKHPRRCRPVVGRDHARVKFDGEYYTSKVIDKDRLGRRATRGLMNYYVDTAATQRKLNRLITRKDGQGWWFFHAPDADPGKEYRRHLVAEVCMTDARGKKEWKVRDGFGSPHYRDCERYAFVAAWMLGLWSLKPKKEARPKKEEEPKSSTRKGPPVLEKRRRQRKGKDEWAGRRGGSWL